MLGPKPAGSSKTPVETGAPKVANTPKDLEDPAAPKVRQPCLFDILGRLGIKGKERALYAYHKNNCHRAHVGDSVDVFAPGFKCCIEDPPCSQELKELALASFRKGK
jgi:hypothetical protein